VRILGLSAGIGAFCLGSLSGSTNADSEVRTSKFGGLVVFFLRLLQSFQRLIFLAQCGKFNSVHPEHSENLSRIHPDNFKLN